MASSRPALSTGRLRNLQGTQTTGTEEVIEAEDEVRTDVGLPRNIFCAHAARSWNIQWMLPAQTMPSP
jgi:hypothetical protein